MDIENFIKQYGEVELAKQIRMEDKMIRNDFGERMSLDGLNTLKKNAKDLKSKVKNKIGSRNSTANNTHRNNNRYQNTASYNQNEEVF